MHFHRAGIRGLGENSSGSYREKSHGTRALPTFSITEGLLKKARRQKTLEKRSSVAALALSPQAARNEPCLGSGEEPKPPLEASCLPALGGKAAPGVPAPRGNAAAGTGSRSGAGGSAAPCPCAGTTHASLQSPPRACRARQLPQPLLRGAQSRLQRCSGVQSNLLGILCW